MKIQQKSMRHSIWSVYRNDKGIATAVGLLILAVLTIIGTTAVMVTTTDIQIGGNYKTSEQAFYAAEAGIEEARARLRANAGTNRINDAPHQANIAWQAYIYIGEDSKAQGKGYDSVKGSTGMHVKTYSLQSALGYTVKIEHQTIPALPAIGGLVAYWGDPNGDGVNTRNTTVCTPPCGQNIYLITSYGTTGTSNQTSQIEATKVPPFPKTPALYVEAQTNVLGTSTFIEGRDACGSDDQAGVGTTLDNVKVGSPPKDSVNLDGQATIAGSPAIQYNNTNMDIQSMVDAFKPYANITPTPQSGTLTGQNWGTPSGGTQGSKTGQTITYPTASSCSTNNIVHFNTGGSYISLTGTSTGCGILLVEGNLELHGGFTWYGPIIVTGSVTFTGGGDKHVSGAILSGGSADADLIGGNANLVYCSTAISSQFENMPLRILSWRKL